MVRFLEKAPEKLSFESLVSQAVRVETELRGLAMQDGALSGEAYVAAAMRTPGANAEEVTMLEEALSRPENALLLPSFRRLCGVIADFKRGSVLRIFRPYLDEDAIGALGRLRCTYASLFVVAAKHMAKTRPELFGTMKSPGEIAEKQAKLLDERERLCGKIEKAWSVADVTVHPMSDSDRQRGFSRITFNITNGEVTLDDARDFAKRIVDCICARQADAEAA